MDKKELIERLKSVVEVQHSIGNYQVLCAEAIIKDGKPVEVEID